MARTYSTTNSWEYWIPGYGQILQLRDALQGHLGEGLAKSIGLGADSPDLASQANEILGNSRNEYLADREHTEMREDTAYQRGVADMRAAGLNPYTIGANPSASSASSVGADTVSNKLQILGYLLDLQNLDAKNRKITNDAIGNVLSIFKIKK